MPHLPDRFNIDHPIAGTILQNKSLRKENERLRNQQVLLMTQILIRLEALCGLLGITASKPGKAEDDCR